MQGRQGSNVLFLTLKALQASHLWLFTLCSVPGCCVPVPAGSKLHSFLFSPPSAVANSPERLPPRSRVSTCSRKQEGEKPKPNLWQCGEGQEPACAWPPSQHCLASAVGCFGAPLGAARPRLGQGEDGECRAMQAFGSSSLVWLGPWAAQSLLTPLFQITKLTQSHRATSDSRKEPAAPLKSRLECLQQAVLKTTAGVPPHGTQHRGPQYHGGDHELWGKGKVHSDLEWGSHSPHPEQ